MLRINQPLQIPQQVHEEHQHHLDCISQIGFQMIAYQISKQQKDLNMIKSILIIKQKQRLILFWYEKYQKKKTFTMKSELPTSS